MPALVAVVVGLLLGLASGGSLSQLAGLKLRWEWLVLSLFIVQAAARGRLLGLTSASQWSLAVWTTASTALVVVMLLNWRTPGMGLGAIGILMNLDVVLLNAAMLVVHGERVQLGQAATAVDIVQSTGGFYRIASQGDLLSWLGDSIPVALGRSILLVSPGDVVLMVAVIVIIVYGTSPSRGAECA